MNKFLYVCGKKLILGSNLEKNLEVELRHENQSLNAYAPGLCRERLVT